MALTLVRALKPDPVLLVVALAVDLVIGDPSYPAHPVRLMGWTLSRVEATLRRLGADGYGGGVALFLVLGAFWMGTTSVLVTVCSSIHPLLGWATHFFLLYSLLALGELLRYGWRVESVLARGDLVGARAAISGLVGRDTEPMDEGACRRAVIESWSENLTDGFISPLLWYAVLGLPGIVLFKVVSTMDSMVGYKTPRYLRFGWCGARMDDLMNFVPARLTWLLLSVSAAVTPGCSAIAALRMGLKQHHRLPSPNSGWSEAASAGAIRRRLAGPIWAGGSLVTEIWLGDPADPPAQDHRDIRRASTLIAVAGIIATGVIVVTLVLSH